MKPFKMGYSVYVSTFDQQKTFLETVKGRNRLVFTSLHIAEEITPDYKEKVIGMLKWLKDHEFSIVGDISKRTLEQFECQTILELAKLLQIDQLRIDYGFSVEEMVEAAKYYPIVFNASTIDFKEIQMIQKHVGEIKAIHNFYPRAYTGLSMKQFEAMNEGLVQHQIEVYSFVPNYKASRGPIYEGLPTVEHHRLQSPYVSALEMWYSQKVECILLSDLTLDPQDRIYLETLEEEQVISLPVQLDKAYSHLAGSVYTIRVDSPDYVLRLQESREYATQGEWMEPSNCIERRFGCITCDNKKYLRYSGELQILKTDLPGDERVNVIGRIMPEYEAICNFIPNGAKIRFCQVD